MSSLVPLRSQLSWTCRSNACTSSCTRTTTSQAPSPNSRWGASGIDLISRHGPISTLVVRGDRGQRTAPRQRATAPPPGGRAAAGGAPSVAEHDRQHDALRVSLPPLRRLRRLRVGLKSPRGAGSPGTSRARSSPPPGPFSIDPQDIRVDQEMAGHTETHG